MPPFFFKVKTLIHNRVELCRNQANSKTLLRMQSGWVVLGDTQFLRGYCLLLPDPVVSSLNCLSLKERQIFLLEMSLIGDAIQTVTQCKRINYEILGNTEEALHAHIFPRYSTEPPEMQCRPVWFYSREHRDNFEFNVGLHSGLMNELREEILKLQNLESS